MKKGGLMAESKWKSHWDLVWPGVDAGERSKWKMKIWSRNIIPSFLTVWDADENSASCTRSAAVYCFALQCRLFRVFCFSSVSTQLGELSLWTAVISLWLHFQMLSLENVKTVVAFGSSELSASHWGWQLQGSGDTVFSREWWASWEALAHKLRSWMEARRRMGRQWETWEQLSSCGPPQSWALVAGILNLKEQMKLFFFPNKLRSLYCGPDHVVWALCGLEYICALRSILMVEWAIILFFWLSGWGKSAADCVGLAWHHVAWPITSYRLKWCHWPLPLVVSHGLPCQGKEGRFAALRSFLDLARGPCSLSHQLLAGVCLWSPCLAYSKRYFSLKCLGVGLERLTCLTLLENRAGFCFSSAFWSAE